MAVRDVLHKNKLEAFKKWLIADGWELQDLKGTYEVLRARKVGKDRPLIIYSKMDAKEHLSVDKRDMGVVGAFLRGDTDGSNNI